MGGNLNGNVGTKGVTKRAVSGLPSWLAEATPNEFVVSIKSLIHVCSSEIFQPQTLSIVYGISGSTEVLEYDIIHVELCTCRIL